MDISLQRTPANPSFAIDTDGQVGQNDISLSTRSDRARPTGRSAPNVPLEDLDAFVNETKQRPTVPVSASRGPARHPEDGPEFGEDGPDDFLGDEFGADYAGNEDEYEDYPDEGDSAVHMPSGPRPSSGYATVEDEKSDLLAKIARYESRGLHVKALNMSSPVEDVRVEYKRLKKEIELQTSLKFSRRALMACVTGMEFLNSKYNPANIHLDGWSEHTYETIDDYDNVFEKLHDKYAQYVQMAPELELLMMVGSSAFMFHLTHAVFKAPSGQASIAANPEIMKSIFKAMGQAQRAADGGAQGPPMPPRPPAEPEVPEPFSGRPQDMPGPSMDLSAFPTMPMMSATTVDPKMKMASLRETILPDPTSQPPPKSEETRRQPGLVEDDLADLDSLAGSDLDEEPATPPPEPKKTPAQPPKAPRKKYPTKRAVETSDNTIEI